MCKVYVCLFSERLHFTEYSSEMQAAEIELLFKAEVNTRQEKM